MELLDDRVNIFCQNKTGVHSAVMRNLDRPFVNHKVAVHGEYVRVIIFCDNLSAYLDEEVKHMFGERKVFLCFLPSNMKNFLHNIDAGLGRSVQISVGRHLDDWLMNNDNMPRWENTMKATERSILATNILEKAMSEVMDTSKEVLHVACFEHTGFLITVIGNETNDSKIRPYGMEKMIFCIPKEPVISLNLVEVTERQSEEEATVAEENLIIDETTENKNELEMEKEIDLTAVVEDAVEDNGDVVDNNPEEVKLKSYNKMYFCSKNIFTLTFS